MHRTSKSLSLADEIFKDLAPLSATPSACTYTAKTVFERPVIIVEHFDPRYAQRVKSGNVTAKNGQDEAWQNSVRETQIQMELCQSFVHPALQAIRQVYPAHGTVYAICALPQTSTVTAENTIAVLDYFHSRNIFGLPLTDGLIDAQTGEIALPKLIDGSLNWSAKGPDAAQGDVEALSTLLASRKSDTVAAPNKTINNGISWHNQIMGHRKSRGRPTAFKNSKRKPLVALACGAALIAAAAFYLTQPPSSEVSITAETTKASAEKPVDLPPTRAQSTPPPQEEVQNDAPAQPSAEEIARAAQRAAIENITYKWHVDLPITTEDARAASNGAVIKILREDPNFRAANPWVRDGQEIRKFNGEPVGPTFDLDEAILALLSQETPPPNLSLTLGDPDLPIEQEVALRADIYARAEIGDIVIRQLPQRGRWFLWVEEVKNQRNTVFKSGDILVGSNADQDQLQHLIGLKAALRESMEPGAERKTVIRMRSGEDLQILSLSPRLFWDEE